MAKPVVKSFRWLLIGAVRVYQRCISPLMPPMCRFYPSCSQYAVEALEKRSVPRALVKIIWRLLRCNPLSRGGYDPVDPDPITAEELAVQTRETTQRK